MENNNGLLIVDDEKNVLQSLKRLLQNNGYRIFTADSGKEGLDILKREEIGVVASDLMMPEMNGVKFLEKASEINTDAVQILLTGHASLDTAVDAINRLGLFCFIVKPWKNEVIKSDFSRAFDKYRLISENRRLNLLTVEQNKQLADLNETLEGRVKTRTLLLEEAVGETISMLARIAETKDNDPEGHIYRVGSMVFELCKGLGLTDEEAELISQFSMVHDIGKVGVNDAILQRKGTLIRDSELATLKSHTIAGEALLGVKPFYQIGRQIVRSHHENWDGTGYPDGLKGDGIPLAARIVAVVDTYDVLAQNKQQNKKTAVLEAFKTIKYFSGTKFDPNVVDTFLRIQANRLNNKTHSAEQEDIAVNA